jgi:hypothetical protein
MPTTEEIADHYSALQDSVSLINGIVNDTAYQTISALEKTKLVERNVAHLQVMVSKDFWTTEDMTAVNAAITAGNNYLNA